MCSAATVWTGCGLCMPSVGHCVWVVLCSVQ